MCTASNCLILLALALCASIGSGQVWFEDAGGVSRSSPGVQLFYDGYWKHVRLSNTLMTLFLLCRPLAQKDELQPGYSRFSALPFWPILLYLPFCLQSASAPELLVHSLTSFLYFTDAAYFFCLPLACHVLFMSQISRSLVCSSVTAWMDQWNCH